MSLEIEELQELLNLGNSMTSYDRRVLFPQTEASRLYRVLAIARYTHDGPLEPDVIDSIMDGSWEGSEVYLERLMMGAEEVSYGNRSGTALCREAAKALELFDELSAKESAMVGAVDAFIKDMIQSKQPTED